jgi:hypothetical protein
MDHEAEMIREQMQETREALTEKLEALEHQVADTVQDAATSVAETVETVTDTVKGTVETVKDSVEDVVTSMRDTFNLRLQVARHPWGMFLGGVALGFVGTRLVQRATACSPVGFSPAPAREPAREPAVAPAANKGGTSLLSWLATTYRDELNGLKALGIGTAAGLVRDMIAQALPPDLGHQVSEWVDSVTSKVGGRPIHGPILRSAPHHDDLGNGGPAHSRF